LDVGFSKTNIEQIQAQQQALEALANYAVANRHKWKIANGMMKLQLQSVKAKQFK
jgi:hypothetical protein